MNLIIQDVRYAFRQLRKNPGFTAVAVLTLALGIGANTAIFSVVNALLLKMLPVKDPQQLVVVGNPADPNERSNGTPSTEVFSYPLYKEFRDRNVVFTALSAAGTDHHIQIEDGGSTSDEKITGRLVSGNYFTMLGLQPAAGRLLSDLDDTAEGAHPVVVLGYSYWQRKFALSPSVIGRELGLNGYSFTIVGVAPRGFEGDVVGEQMALFVPLSMQPQIIRGRHWLKSATSSWLSLIGRLKPGVAPAQAEANMNLVFQQALKSDFGGAALTTDDRNAVRDLHIRVSPGGGGLSDLRASYRVPLLLLMGIVGLVLLIACVNVANLLLARATARNREVAVRLAIGASARRLLQQLLTESILLAALGGVAGSLLAIWAVPVLVKVFESSANLPVVPDFRVLAFTLVVILVTGVLFGLAPALRLLRVNVSPVLKDANRTTAGTNSRFSWSKSLIAAQVALSVLVLFAAGLLIRSLQKLMAQDFGYSRDHLVIARTDPTSAGYSHESMKSLAEQLSSGIRSAPGVHAVTYSTNGLFAGTENADAVLVPGFQATTSGGRVAFEDYVGPDYFGTIGIPILAGRGIEMQDSASSTRVAVVNEAMVKYFFQGQNPIGRQFRIDSADWRDKPITIVGISRNAKDHDNGIREDVKPRFYMAFQQVPESGQVVIEAQATGDPGATVATITSQIKAVDSHLPISFVRTLASLVNGSASDQIALAKLSSFFAGLGLLLASIGLYGVMSYTVSGRTREIGVRMAMGARQRDVVQLVLGEGLLLVAVGIAAGLPLALAGSQLLKAMLFEMSSADPLSLITVVLLLGAVAGLAGLIPARRAAKVDPMVALRYE